MNARDELLDFLVGQIPTEKLANFQSSEDARRRVWGLIAKEKETGLLPEEKLELEDYLKLEHLLVLAKTKARLTGPHVEGVGQALRREVAARAGHRCEYCRLPEWALLAGCEVDHVISRKHGGPTDEANLALSCARCSRAKGSDIGSIVPETSQFCRLFNPRTDRWEEHFLLDGARLVGRTEPAQVTINLLRLNDDERLLERAWLQQLGEYPK